MRNLKTVEKKVRAILEKNEDARNDDMVLYLALCNVCLKDAGAIPLTVGLLPLEKRSQLWSLHLKERYRAKTRFCQVFNLPELMLMFREVADIQTADMLKAPVPKVNYHNVKTKPSEIQTEMVASLAKRAESTGKTCKSTICSKSRMTGVNSLLTRE